MLQITPLLNEYMCSQLRRRFVQDVVGQGSVEWKGLHTTLSSYLEVSLKCPHAKIHNNYMLVKRGESGDAAVSSSHT